MNYLLRKLLRLLLVGLGYLWALSTLAQAAETSAIGMVTGSRTGTYIQFGQDIAGVAKPLGLEIAVKDSQGSIDNIKRLHSKENAALGIVQSDVLGFLKRSESPDMRQVASRLRLIFPFYAEEVHLFANKSVRSFNDLQGKRVVVGEQGSGNWLTAMNLLQMTEVQPAVLLQLTPLQGVTAVLKGEADAMFYVAGKPVSLFTKVGNLITQPQFAAMLANVHFVPLDDPRMVQEYAKALISKGDYEWLAADTPTISVTAVLMSFDFSGKSNPYFTQRCQQLAQLGQAIRSNLNTLRDKGHAKWREVNLDAPVSNWPLDTCSRQGVKAGDTKPDLGRALEKLLLNQAEPPLRSAKALHLSLVVGPHAASRFSATGTAD